MVDAEFFQAGELYRRVLNNKNRENLVYNITFSLSGANKKIQYRQTALFYKVDKEFGRAVSAKLNLDLEKVERLAGMSQKERIDVTKDWT